MKQKQKAEIRKQSAGKKQPKFVDLSTITKKVWQRLEEEVSFELIHKILRAEQSVCTEQLAKGEKIIMWNYLTMYTSIYPGRKLKCPMNGKTYDVQDTVKVNVRIGEGLRRAVQKPKENMEAPIEDEKLSPSRKKSKAKLYADRFVQITPKDKFMGKKPPEVTV